MHSERAYAWSNAAFRWSVISLVLATVGMVLVGFVWLPSVHDDFTAAGLWASICRAAGVPTSWASTSQAAAVPQATQVVLDRAMTRNADATALGRGATLALNCTMCHGAQGMSTSD